MNLIEHLQQVRDLRTRPVYPLSVVLLLAIMATMSGCHGYRPLAAFVQRHQTQLLALLNLPHQRLPRLSTLRRLLERTDYTSLTARFNAWAQESFGEQPGQLAIDGKSIKASLRDYDQPYQDFVALVSAFSVEQAVVVALEPMHNGSSSEITTVETLLALLRLQGACFSLDALHAQKKQLPVSSPVATTI
jgi:hypothetical protein